MASELIINCNHQEVRVALMESGILTELYVERQAEKGVAGNIYKGRVLRVLPGMQAAFVDIGLNRSAFLYVTDAFVDYAGIESMLIGFQEEDNGLSVEASPEGLGPWGYRPPIEELLQEGQDIVVQVSKEPIGSKGARLTCHISLPGRHLVLMPTVNHVGVSRRIEDDGERKRVKEIVLDMKPPDVGFIVRTAGEGKNEEDLRLEMDFLLRLWENIQAKKAVAPVPGVLHHDLDIALRAIRDLYTKDVQKVVVDSDNEYYRVEVFRGALRRERAHI
jgi:ribonuclease G